MGSEHSTQGGSTPGRPTSFDDSAIPLQKANFRRQHTIANPGGTIATFSHQTEDNERPGSTSPGPSVCSDTDLPYISYTVNRPIGDSPKISKTKLKSQAAARKNQPANKSTPVTKKAHNIVVVKPALVGPNVDKDPDILRLQNIPMFLPIMRATLNLPAARDPEVLERLDPVPLQKLCSRYQGHMHACANLVATEQNALTLKVREVDADVSKMVAWVVERQKHIGKHYEKLRKVNDLSHHLNHCHIMLNQILESMETLNNMLDIDDRLEPFVWTTG